MPMLVTRIERTLAIDGVYVHVCPVAVFYRIFLNEWSR